MAVARQLVRCSHSSTGGSFPDGYSVSRSRCASNGLSASRSSVQWLVSFRLCLRISLSLSIPLRLLRTALCWVWLIASSSLFSLPSGSPWSPHLLSLGHTLPSCRLPPWDLSVAFSLLRGPPSEPLSSGSLFGSFPGRSSFCSRWRPLVGLGNFRLSRCRCLPWGLPCFSLTSWFSDDASVFRSSSPSLFSVVVSSGICGLFRPSSSCVPFGLFSCASLVLLLFLPVLVLSLSLHALLLAPFLRMPSVSSSVLSWLEHFLRLVILFLMLLACPTLLSLPFRLLVFILPLVRVGCVGLRCLGFSSQCSFGFYPCGTFLIFSFRLSSFSHSVVQFSSSSVYGLGSLLAERFCTLGFTCSHF